MKIFTNNSIKYFFVELLICMAIYILSALFIIKYDFSNIFIFIMSIIMILAILIITILYFLKQNKIIENAAEQITDYISGNQNSRIECNKEGELYKLFHEVNNLVCILNAHAENEAISKKFLKDTISDISHQLKTPLAALNIYNGLIMEEDNLSDIKHFVGLSEQELDRMEILVKNLLKMTKIDAGTILIDKKQENIFKIIDCVKDQFSFRAECEDKKIILSGEKDIYLMCDRDWILEAIANIVKNALDHTKAGDVINIEWKRFASIVQIIIKDNGSGIHPEDIHHIFKRFYRSRFSKDTQGIGLGLSLVKTIIETHKGSIEVDSELGIGTTFVINFLITTKL